MPVRITFWEWMLKNVVCSCFSTAGHIYITPWTCSILNSPSAQDGIPPPKLGKLLLTHVLIFWGLFFVSVKHQCPFQLAVSAVKAGLNYHHPRIKGHINFHRNGWNITLPPANWTCPVRNYAHLSFNPARKHIGPSVWHGSDWGWVADGSRNSIC